MTVVQDIDELSFDRIISMLPCHVYWKDKNGVYLGCNDRQAQALGLHHPSQITRRLAYADLPAQVAAELRIADDKIMMSRVPKINEEPGIRLDGSIGTFLSHKIPLVNNNGEPIGLLGMSLDITDKKIADERRKAHEIMKQISNAKTSLLNGINLEIRRPLSNIIGLVQTLKNKQFTSESYERLSIIEQSAKSVTPILDRINYYHDLENSQLAALSDAVNLPVFIESIIKEYQDEIDYKHLTMIKHFPIGLPKRLKTDAGLLFEVINNLIANAIKHSQQGDISLTISHDQPIDNETLYVSFTVKDNGPGIPLQKQKHLFDFFDCNNNNGADLFAEGGMKLSITKKIVELLGGKITVISDGKQGSQFNVILPFGIVPTDSCTNKTMPSVKLLQKVDYRHADNKPVIADKHLIILLIEDNMMNQRVIQLMLEESFDCRVEVASETQDGIDKASHNHYDVILSDISLPDGTGLQIIEHLQKQPKNHKPFFVGITAHLTEKELGKCYEAGFIEVLPKPITVEMLRALFDTIWLDKNNEK